MVDMSSAWREAAARDQRRIDRLRLALESIEADYMEKGLEGENTKNDLLTIIKMLVGMVRASELSREKWLAMITTPAPAAEALWTIVYRLSESEAGDALTAEISTATHEEALERLWKQYPGAAVYLIHSDDRLVSVDYNPPRTKAAPAAKPAPDFRLATDWLVEYENGAYPCKLKATTPEDAEDKFWTLFPGRAILSLTNPLNDWRAIYDPPLKPEK